MKVLWYTNWQNVHILKKTVRSPNVCFYNNASVVGYNLRYKKLHY